MKGNIVKTLNYYKRQVQLFLKDFLKKLKPEEPSIWKEKVSKTSDDVYAAKRNKKEKPKSYVNHSAQYMGGYVSALPSLSAVNHFARANKAALNKVEGNEVPRNNEVIEESLDKDMAVEAEVEYKREAEVAQKNFKTLFEGTFVENFEVI